jgi:hypothetical protein
MWGWPRPRRDSGSVIVAGLALPVLVTAAHHGALHAPGSASLTVHGAVVREPLPLLGGEDGAGLVLCAQAGEHHVGVHLSGALRQRAGGSVVEALRLAGRSGLPVHLLHLRHDLLVSPVHALVRRFQLLDLVGGQAKVLAVLERRLGSLCPGRMHGAAVHAVLRLALAMYGAVTGVGILGAEQAGAGDQQRSGGGENGGAHEGSSG